MKSSPEPEEQRTRKRGLLQQPIQESSEDNSSPEPDPQAEPEPDEHEPEIEEPALQQTQQV